jgi:hypothetical protein
MCHIHDAHQAKSQGETAGQQKKQSGKRDAIEGLQGKTVHVQSPSSRHSQGVWAIQWT